MPGTRTNAMLRLMERLYPICRSITGDGVRETLAILGEQIDLEIHEVPTGTQVFDWTVPREWNIRDAWVAGPDERRVVDFADSNLHVMSYSVPVRATMSLEELQPHLYSLPELPDAIPYRTSYYAERWGFCLPHAERESLKEGEYEVCIDSRLEDGSLTYAEHVVPGTVDAEILVHTHVCHPSLANDNLSGIAVATALARAVASRPHRFTYRFLFAPGTIGAITWLALNRDRLDEVQHGLILSGLGDPGPLTYKRSRSGTAAIDGAAAHVVTNRGGQVADFDPYGYDERQVCSPGIDLPMGRLGRTPWGEYEQYHTSLDNLEFVRPETLEGALDAALEVFEILETDAVYVNRSPYCEPQLGRRGLYGTIGGEAGRKAELAMLWVLNQSDGTNSLMAIAEKSCLPFHEVRAAADRLIDAGLLGSNTQAVV